MATAQSEPSMDEILASIRRIISEEDEAPAAVRRDADAPLTLGEADEVDDVLGEEPATDNVTADAAPAEQDGDELVADAAASFEDTPEEGISEIPEVQTNGPDPLDDFSGAGDAIAADAANELMNEEIAPMAQANGVASLEEPASSPVPNGKLAGLVSEVAASQVNDAFGSLQQNVRVSSGSGRTVEDVIEAMLAPMLKEWLEQNLPRIVEEKVEDEVRRISRR